MELEVYSGTEGESLTPESSPAAAEVLSNDLILEQVFLHLDAASLLELSLVNKQWCSRARAVLRTSKCCVARICSTDPADELLRFNATLTESVVHPYSGLGIFALKAEENSTTGLNCTEDVSEIFQALLEKITYHHLFIYWQREIPCAGFALLVKILREKRAEFTILGIGSLPTFIGPSLKQYLEIDETHWLPNVNMLYYESPSLGHELMRAAPLLQDCFAKSFAEDLDFYVSNNKVGLMRKLTLLEEDFAGFTEEEIRSHPITEFISSNPKLATLRFIDCEYGNLLDPEIVQDLLRRLLESISSSLENLSLDIFNFLLLPTVPPNPMRALRELKLIDHSYDSMESPILPLLARVDWDSWFPVLEFLATRLDGTLQGEELVTTVIDQIKLELQQRPLSRCMTCTKLFLGFWEICRKPRHFDTMAFWTTMMPNIKILCIYGVSGSDLENTLNFVWTAWPELEEVIIMCEDFACDVPNLDSTFCGISKEQASYYYKSCSLQALRTFELVPEAPSILLLKRLLRLQMIFTKGCCCSRSEGARARGSTCSKVTRFFSEMTKSLPWNSRRERPCILSHVTTALTFDRTFKVEIELGELGYFTTPAECGDCRAHLNHLKPFLTHFC